MQRMRWHMPVAVLDCSCQFASATHRWSVGGPGTVFVSQQKVKGLTIEYIVKSCKMI